MLLLCFVLHIKSKPISITIKRQVFFHIYQNGEENKSPEVAKLERTSALMGPDKK